MASTSDHVMPFIAIVGFRHLCQEYTINANSPFQNTQVAGPSLASGWTRSRELQCTSVTRRTSFRPCRLGKDIFHQHLHQTAPSGPQLLFCSSRQHCFPCSCRQIRWASCAAPTYPSRPISPGSQAMSRLCLAWSKEYQFPSPESGT
jgi:hypothetical protein